MAKPASRILKVRGLYFDGKDDYVVAPLTVYGWREITIAEWIYAVWPKPNTYWSKFSMIGYYSTGWPSTFHLASNYTDYTYIYAYWITVKPDGTLQNYAYNWFSEVNKWAFVVRRFTADREYSFWVNGVKKYSNTVPSDYKTILEWNPNVADSYYRRFVLGANTGFDEYMSLIQGELRVYNRALSDAEISEIYAEDTFIKDGLILCFLFNDGEGNIAHDSSGNGNNGTLYGNPVWKVKKALRVLPKAR